MPVLQGLICASRAESVPATQENFIPISSAASNRAVSPVPVFGVGSARWPDGPPHNGVSHGFSLIPVSGVGVAVDGEKTGGNGFEGTLNKEMAKGEMTFLDTQRIVRPLSQTCDHMWRAQREKVRVCAYGEVLSVHTPSRSWQLTTIETFSLAISFLRPV